MNFIKFGFSAHFDLFDPLARKAGFEKARSLQVWEKYSIVTKTRRVLLCLDSFQSKESTLPYIPAGIGWAIEKQTCDFNVKTETANVRRRRSARNVWGAFVQFELLLE